jgi:hypothetical protein
MNDFKVLQKVPENQGPNPPLNTLHRLKKQSNVLGFISKEILFKNPSEHALLRVFNLRKRNLKILYGDYKVMVPSTSKSSIHNI